MGRRLGRTFEKKTRSFGTSQLNMRNKFNISVFMTKINDLIHNSEFPMVIVTRIVCLLQLSCAVTANKHRTRVSYIFSAQILPVLVFEWLSIGTLKVDCSILFRVIAGCVHVGGALYLSYKLCTQFRSISWSEAMQPNTSRTCHDMNMWGGYGCTACVASERRRDCTVCGYCG